MDLTNKVVGITFGIRYARSFRVPDVSGDIIDDILYEENSPFKDLYEGVKEPPSREKILSNPLTNEYLRINTDDLILGTRVKNDFTKKYQWLNESVIPYLEKLFTEYKIKNILRIGIIFHHKISKSSKFKEIISQVSNDAVTDTENISISFAKKLATVDGTLKKGVSDYRNTIYIFEELRSGFLADIDYQHYFQPMVEDLRECSAKSIVQSARSFLSDNYYPWLSTYEKPKKS